MLTTIYIHTNSLEAATPVSGTPCWKELVTGRGRLGDDDVLAARSMR